MPELHTIATFAVASIALLIIPGPAMLFIVNRSVSDGRAIGLAAVAGIQVGTSVHVVAAAAGLSAVLAASAAAFNVVKWLGVVYLVGIGVRTLFTRPDPLRADVEGLTPRRAFRQGVIVNTLNPKVALFFLSFLPQFIDSSRPAWSQSLVLGVVFVSLGVLSDSMCSLLASSLRGVLIRGRGLPLVQRYFAGSMFIVLGLLAATTGRTTSHS